MATCLLKHVCAKVDYQAENYALHYLKTKDNQEVDFALVKDDNIEQIIEVKNSNHEINKSLYQFNKKYNFCAVQVVKELRQERTVDFIEIVKATNYLKDLFL